MDAGDYVHIAGWRVIPTNLLLPRSPDSPTFLDQMLTHLVVNHARDNVRFAIITPGAGYLSNCQISS